MAKKDTTKKIAERDLKKTLTKGETAGMAIGAGALSDAIAFAPYDPNLADFLVRFPATKNALTEWLQTDPNGDPGMERLKNAISGGIPSVFIPPFLGAVSKGFVWSKNKIGQKGAEVLLKDIDQLLLNIKRLALKHKYTLCIGRSHGIHAEPITFGLKMLTFYQEFFRNKKRLENSIKEISTCAISGAMGTFANIDPKVESYVAKKLKLNVEPISTQNNTER